MNEDEERHKEWVRKTCEIISAWEIEQQNLLARHRQLEAKIAELTQKIEIGRELIKEFENQRQKPVESRAEEK